MNRQAIGATLASSCLVALVFACAGMPRQRNWNKHTLSQYDDYEKSLPREELEQYRAKVMSAEPDMDLWNYGFLLVRFLWEVEPMLEARANAAANPELEFKDPSAIANFDPEEYINEFEAKIAEFEATSGYQTELQHIVAIARKDCDATIRGFAIPMSCDPMSGGIINPFDYTKIACDGPQQLCRTLFDIIPDGEHRHRIMERCIKHVGGEPDAALATWATPEEIDFYHNASVTLAKRDAEEKFWRQMAANGAREENQRRQQEYDAERANYDANQGAIESVSKIGHLDPADGPPGQPEMITSVSVPIQEYAHTAITEHALVVFENQCARDVNVARTRDDVSEPKTAADRITVPPGERGSIEVTRCTSVYFEPADGEGRIDQIYMTEMALGFGLREDCETVYRIDPAGLTAITSAPAESDPEPSGP